MSSVTTIRSDNKLVGSKHYGTILREYNRQYQEGGRVEGKTFYYEIIKPLLSEYSLSAWYQFIRKFKNDAGLEIIKKLDPPVLVPGDAAIEENTLQSTILSNNEAIKKGISSALNLGAAFYNKLWEKYSKGEELTKFEESCIKDAMFKAMKSQDSRIHAIGKIREDGREEEKMDREFTDSAYG